MKLLIPITAIIAAASAGQVYHVASHPEAYQYQAQPNHQGQLDQYQGHVNQYQGQIDQNQAYAHEMLSSRPVSEKIARVVNSLSETDGHGYKYSYETENGIKFQEHGQTGHGSATQGAYSYTGDDGQIYTVSYSADENGFRVHGDHLPTPPPVPEEILKGLEQNAKEEAAGIFDDGAYKHQQSEGESHGYQSAQGDHQAQNTAYQALRYQTSGAHTAAVAINPYHGHQ